MTATATCCSECPCQQGFRDEEVVPYQGTLGCPTDEELLCRWREDRCEKCLTWWVMRVQADPRYEALIRAIQREFPHADVAGCLNDLLLEIWSYEKPIRHPRTYFRLLLWQRAIRDSGGGRKVQVRSADPQGELDTLSSYPCEHLADRTEWLEHCYEKLGDRARSLMDSFYYDDQSIGQIAQQERLSYDACARRLSRIRSQLRECIEQAV